MESYRTLRMSSSSLPVTIKYPVTPTGPSLSRATAGCEAQATTPTAELLDNDAVRLLVDFFLLLAKWDAKQNRNFGATFPGTTIHPEADMAAERKVSTAGRPARCTARAK